MDKFIVDEWLKFAQDDFDAANFLLNFHPLKLEIICFHCQQSAEKDLKAFLISRKVDFPKIHDLKELCTLCEENNNSFDDIKKECIRLTKYATQPRYPFALEITEDDMHLAISDAEKVKEFVKGVINV